MKWVYRMLHAFTGHPLADSDDATGVLMYCRPCRRVWSLQDWRF